MVAWSFRAFAMALALLVCAGIPALAEEGHWPFDQVPVAQIAAIYGVALTPELFEHIEHSTVRVGQTGTSGAFVSATGLVLTAHHVAALDTKSGFVAHSLADERPMPGISLDAIIDRRDVSARVRHALAADKSSEAYFLHRRSLLSDIEHKALSGTVNAAQVITLAGGRRYVLYRYHRYTDVRLVMAPDDATGYLTGPYPSPSLDYTFLRAYENGHPARTPTFLRFSDVAPTDGTPVFISGAPYANSKRSLPVAELRFLRDVEQPLRSQSAHKLAERMVAWNVAHSDHGTLADYIATSTRFIAGVIDAQLAAFRDNGLTGVREGSESRLMDAMRAADDREGIELFRRLDALIAQLGPARVRTLLMPWSAPDDPTPWDLHDEVLPWGTYISPPTLSYATLLVRAHEQRKLNDQERARGFHDADRIQRERWLFEAGCPEHTTCGQATDQGAEEVILATYLETLAEQLSLDDPIVKVALAGMSFGTRAHELLASTRLRDPTFRRLVYEASDADLLRLRDPLLDVAFAIHALALQAGTQIEASRLELARLREQAAERCGQYLNDSCPSETTGAVTLGYGAVSGLERADSPDAFEETPWLYSPAVSTMGLLYEFANHSHPPYGLSEAWISAKPEVRADLPLDFLSTADCVAGNSGSVTVDKTGQVIGVAFSSFGGGVSFDFVYEGALKNPARCEHVAVSAIRESLEKVFKAHELLAELRFESAHQ